MRNFSRFTAASPRKSLPPAAVPAIVGFGYFVIPCMVFTQSQSLFFSPFGWSVVCLVVVLVPIVFRRRDKRLDVFEPIYPVMIYFGLLFGARGIYAASTGFRDMRFATEDLVTGALALAVTGMMGIYLGYRSKIGELLAHKFRVRPFLQAGDYRYPVPIIALAALLGIGGELAMVRLSASISPDNILTTAGTFWVVPLMDCLAFALYMSVLNRKSDRSGPFEKAFQVAALVLIVACFVVRPSKRWLLQPGYYLLVLYHYRHKRISPVTLVALGFIGFASAQLIRLYTVGFSYDRYEFARRLAYTLQSPTETWRLLFNRFYGLDSLAMIILHTKATGQYYLGATYKDLLYFFVPRVIWPGKPITISYEFGHLLSRYAGWGSGEFAASTIFGDLYLNFGALGILAGAPIIGILMRTAYEFLVVRVGSKSAILIYAVILLYCTQSCEAMAAVTIPLLISDLAPLVILLCGARALENSTSGPERLRREIIAPLAPLTPSQYRVIET
jgi:hypothetical protein